MKNTLKPIFLRKRSSSIITICVTLILFATLTPYLTTPPIHYIDKITHFIIFFFLSVNIGYKYYNTKNLIPALSGAILLAAGTEIIQKFIPERSMDLKDVLTDIAGIIIGFIFYYAFQSTLNKLLVWFWGKPQN